MNETYRSEQLTMEQKRFFLFLDCDNPYGFLRLPIPAALRLELRTLLQIELPRPLTQKTKGIFSDKRKLKM